MKGRQVGRVNQPSKGETPLKSGVIQRAAERTVANKEEEATQEVESVRNRESRFRHDFSQVPINTGEKKEKETKTPNTTGLPENLKAGVENLSGYSLDDIRVHYNSPKPDPLKALAYTQGKEIHVAPGQEEHLPHEAWHVVQQMQGRVKPTKQMKDRVAVNDEEWLEREADVMGEKAVAGGAKDQREETQRKGLTVPPIVQRMVKITELNKEWGDGARVSGPQFDVKLMRDRGWSDEELKKLEELVRSPTDYEFSNIESLRLYVERTLGIVREVREEEEVGSDEDMQAENEESQDESEGRDEEEGAGEMQDEEEGEGGAGDHDAARPVVSMLDDDEEEPDSDEEQEDLNSEDEEYGNRTETDEEEEEESMSQGSVVGGVKRDVGKMAQLFKELFKGKGIPYSGSKVYAVARDRTVAEGERAMRSSGAGRVSSAEQAVVNAELKARNPGFLVGELKYPSNTIKEMRGRGGIEQPQYRQGNAHAEVQIYIQMKLLATEHGINMKDIGFEIASDIAHCAECYWALQMIAKNATGKFTSVSGCENKIFGAWREPWVGFYKQMGADNPFRDALGELRTPQKNKKGEDIVKQWSAEELNKMAGSDIYQ